jgi:hypothetical protein
MRSALWFLIGYIVSGFVSCAVLYKVGSSLLSEFRMMHQAATELYDKATATIAKMHVDALAAVTRIEDKAKAVGKDLTA